MYVTKNGAIELRLLGSNEPNNGRMIIESQLFIDKLDVTERFFLDQWNYLNRDLCEFRFESDNSDYVYVPAESHSFVICAKTRKVRYMPHEDYSTVRFRGNIFKGDLLIIYYSEKTVEIDLKKSFSEYKTIYLQENMQDVTNMKRKNANHKLHSGCNK